jgi:hypothetical protein
MPHAHVTKDTRCGLEREGRSSGERPGNAGTGVRRISQFPENSHGSRLYPGLRAGSVALSMASFDDVDGLAPWGVRAGQLRVAFMIFRVQ